MSGKLFGTWHVTPTGTAISEAHGLFPKYGDYQEARKHALKLAFWPHSGTAGQVGDLNWELISGMREPKAYELRIDDCIGGYNNLRILFWVPSTSNPLPGDLMPRIWTIGVMQKKTQRFTNNDLRVFRARVTILQRRKYG